MYRLKARKDMKTLWNGKQGIVIPELVESL